MKRQGFPIFLILMMLITPIASAFDHCVGMDMPGHISESQHFSVASLADVTDDTIPLDHQMMLKESPNTQTDMDCLSSSICTIHICGAYAISSSAPVINIISSSSYSIIEHTSPYHTILAPDLRPPIAIL